MARASNRPAGLLVLGVLMVVLATITVPATARDTSPPVLARGARVGVLSLLDSEVTQYHGARVLQEAFRKTYRVDWPVAGMLSDAVKGRLEQLGLTVVPLEVTDELDRGREACFLNGSFAKELPKDCVLPIQHLLTATNVDGLIVLAPGLNDSRHAGSTRRRNLPEDLRGWGFVSGAGGSPEGKPLAFSMTELLLVLPAQNGPVLEGREWGGGYSLEWSSYAPGADPKDLSPEAFAQLQPIFAGLLSRQAARLLEPLQIKP